MTACTSRSLVYENICVDCNPEAVKKGELQNINMEIPSVYVGETARSVQERAKEHWEGFKNKKEDNHILKHWVLHHNSTGEPNFIMKVVKFHRTALSRQVGEAIRIHKRGMVLNSKGEYNRCHITRLSLGNSEDFHDKQAEQGGEEDLDKDWTEVLLAGRDRVDKDDRQGLGRMELYKGAKRKEDNAGTKRKKRMRYARLEDDWGMTGDLDPGNGSTLISSGLEGARTDHEMPGVIEERPRQKSKATRTLEKAAGGLSNITDWMVVDNNAMEGIQ